MFLSLFRNGQTYRHALQSVALAAAATGAVSVFAACSSKSSDSAPAVQSHPPAPPPPEDSTFGPKPANACADTIDSIYGAVASAGTYDRTQRGTILRCAKDGHITSAELEARTRADGYKGRAFTSGASVYRVLYQTERGTSPAGKQGNGGISSALVFLPDTPRATTLPVLVASHGTRGQAAVCAPSKADPAAEDVRSHFELQVFPLVGSGFAVIAPDLAGYANYGSVDSPSSGYAFSDDVAKSTLDGARALRKLAPAIFSEKVVFVGHSQGGHTAFSALALAESYGLDGTLVGVATYSPLWFTQATWGGVLMVANQYPTKVDPPKTSVAVWYHYSHGEAIDGPGHGVDVFEPSKRAKIKEFYDTTCWQEGYPNLEALGTTPADLFAPEFIQAVSPAAAMNGSCTGEGAAKALCEKWTARYAADRPHLTGAALSVPILLAYGTKDVIIPPDRATCGVDRLKSDHASLSVCVVPGADHVSIMAEHSNYITDWIGSKALGEAAQPACENDERAIVDDAGTVITCNPLPPND